uniref:Uncharacterized protein n=1 Tax=Paramoeba aestuarina TaxID=180227 RepID=A0A7S4PBA0_9EUKA|mmetsp:Transcript_39655/g.62715  ORF Transcript_39655/g.62715 Transcript_39655/m.62715 type:complete len:611 (+) Transcript_39655:105-1937(+)
MRALPFFLLVALFVGFLSAIPSYVLRGHFDGRSGNVIISPNYHRRSSGLLFLDHARHTREGIVNDINVANLIAHIFQTTPPTNERQPLTIDRSSFPVLSLFSAPPANVFVVIEAVSPEDLAAFPSLSLIKTRKKIEIRSTYQSHDSLPDMETLITGVPPAQHGIVGRSWLSSQGTETSAFIDRGSGSKADSLFDVLALTSPESLILSMSSDEQAASSIGVRVPSRANTPHVLSYYWNSNRQNFGTVKYRLNHPIKSSRADILESLLFQTQEQGGEKYGFFVYKGITLDMDQKNMQVFVTTPRSTRVAFDLNAEEDFRVFVELFFVSKAAQLLQGDLDYAPQVADDHPDSFSFSFSAIRYIRQKYGLASPQFSTALLLVDAAMTSFMDTIQTLYHHRAASQIIFFPPPENKLKLNNNYHNNKKDDDIVEQIEEVVSQSVGSIKSFLPEIYMGHELSSSGEEANLVTQLNSFLNDLGFTAYWFGRQDLKAQELVLSGGDEKKTPVFKSASVAGQPVYKRKKRNNDVTDFNWNVYKWFGFKFNWSGIVYTQKQVELYQIEFWASFFLLIITIGSCCSMCLLNPEKNNEVLYRQTALGRETDTIPGGDYDFKTM